MSSTSLDLKSSGSTAAKIAAALSHLGVAMYTMKQIIASYNDAYDAVHRNYDRSLQALIMDTFYKNVYDYCWGSYAGKLLSEAEARGVTFDVKTVDDDLLLAQPQEYWNHIQEKYKYWQLAFDLEEFGEHFWEKFNNGETQEEMDAFVEQLVNDVLGDDALAKSKTPPEQVIAMQERGEFWAAGIDPAEGSSPIEEAAHCALSQREQIGPSLSPQSHAR